MIWTVFILKELVHARKINWIQKWELKNQFVVKWFRDGCAPLFSDFKKKKKQAKEKKERNGNENIVTDQIQVSLFSLRTISTSCLYHFPFFADFFLSVTTYKCKICKYKPQTTFNNVSEFCIRIRFRFCDSYLFLRSNFHFSQAPIAASQKEIVSLSQWSIRNSIEFSCNWNWNFCFSFVHSFSLHNKLTQISNR